MNPDLTPWMSDKLDELLRFAARSGVSAHVVSTRRSCAEQNAIYESAPGVATQARGCISWHVWGRAADLHIDGLSDGYAILGEYWKKMGGVWGGDWGWDPGHFEWHPGLKISDVCTGDADCPDPDLPWPEDRPFLARPGVRAFFGVGLASIGVVLARRVLSR
jgi:hypothetical protein